MKLNLDFLEEKEALTPNQERERQESLAHRSRLVTKEDGDGAALQRVAQQLDREQQDRCRKESRERKRQYNIAYGRKRRQRWDVRAYEREYQRQRRIAKGYKGRKGPVPRVLVTENGEEYPNVKVAAKAVGVAEVTLYAAVAKPWLVIGGQRWKYKDAPRPLDWNVGPRFSCSRAVVTSDGEYYPSIRAAAKAMKCSSRWVWESILKKHPCKGRHRVYYATDPEAVELVRAVGGASDAGSDTGGPDDGRLRLPERVCPEGQVSGVRSHAGMGAVDVRGA